jgi:hypothetical protein
MVRSARQIAAFRVTARTPWEEVPRMSSKFSLAALALGFSVLAAAAFAQAPQIAQR